MTCKGIADVFLGIVLLDQVYASLLKCLGRIYWSYSLNDVLLV